MSPRGGGRNSRCIDEKHAVGRVDADDEIAAKDRKPVDSATEPHRTDLSGPVRTDDFQRLPLPHSERGAVFSQEGAGRFLRRTSAGFDRKPARVDQSRAVRGRDALRVWMILEERLRRMSRDGQRQPQGREHEVPL